jgi:hypothetical protein
MTMSGQPGQLIARRSGKALVPRQTVQQFHGND